MTLQNTKATNSITMEPNFSSNTGDEFVANIVEDTGEEPGERAGSSFSGEMGGYRYGFNGKENDDEVQGVANQQDYGMRIYDPRLGKFLSVDPLIRSYPWYTPYQFAGNTPIQAIDLDGLEEFKINGGNEVVSGPYRNKEEAQKSSRRKAGYSTRTGSLLRPVQKLLKKNPHWLK